MEILQSFVSLFLFMKCIIFLWLFSGLFFVSSFQHVNYIVFEDYFFEFILFGIHWASWILNKNYAFFQI